MNFNSFRFCAQVTIKHIYEKVLLHLHKMWVLVLLPNKVLWKKQNNKCIECCLPTSLKQKPKRDMDSRFSLNNFMHSLSIIMNKQSQMYHWAFFYHNKNSLFDIISFAENFIKHCQSTQMNFEWNLEKPIKDEHECTMCLKTRHGNTKFCTNPFLLFAISLSSFSLL